MNYPLDIKKTISSYIPLHDRLGFASLDKILEKQLLQPRDKNGRALKMTSYYYLPKKVGGFRKFGHAQNSFFLRRSKLDFMYIVYIKFYSASFYCEINMFPQYETTEKLQSIMLHPDLISFVLSTNTKIWITQANEQLRICWTYDCPLGYQLHDTLAYQNYPAKLKQEAWDIVCNLIEKSNQLKKSHQG